MLRRICDRINVFPEVFVMQLPAELAAIYLRDVVSALDDVIGVVSTEDLLGQVFSQFCVGK